MKTLLMYATNSGGTFSASQYLSDMLSAPDSPVTMKEALEVTSPSELDQYDLVILASPSWDYNGDEGQPHEHFMTFMDMTKEKLYEGRAFAIVGLGDSSYTHFCGAVDHLEKWVNDKKGKLLVSSLRIDGYYYKPDSNDFLKTWAEGMQKVVTA